MPDDQPTRKQRATNASPTNIDLDAVMDQHRKASASHRSQSDRPSWLPALGGVALVIFGMSRRSLSRFLLVVTGGAVTAVAVRSKLEEERRATPDGERSIRVEKSITVNKSIDEVYRVWSDFDALPRFVPHLQSVESLGDGRTRWKTAGPFGQSVEWDAEMLADERNRAISWRSVGESGISHLGAVHFQEAPGDRGTEVLVRVEYVPPLGQLGAVAAKLLGDSPGQQVEDSLRSFKELLETGERPTTGHQARGNSAVSKMDIAMGKLRQLFDAAGAVAGNR